MISLGERSNTTQKKKVQEGFGTFIISLMYLNMDLPYGVSIVIVLTKMRKKVRGGRR